jgi:outer membrane protein
MKSMTAKTRFSHLKAHAIVLACVLVSVSPMALAQDAALLTTLQNARELMAAKNSPAAYSLLAAQEATRAGTPDFDYLLGIAALDSGRVTNAIFALERVLAVQPGNALARAELARAYLVAGELETAKQELTQVQMADIPPAARETISRLLGSFDTAQTADKRPFKAYVEAGIARDSNLNSGPSNNFVTIPIAIPFFGGLVVPVAKPQSDTVAHVGAGLALRTPLTTQVELVGGLNLRQTRPSSHNELDTGSVDGNLGLIYSSGTDQFNATLNLGSTSFDGQQYRTLSGVSGQWTRALSTRSQGSAFVQYTQLRFPSAQSRDANRTILGLAYAEAVTPALTAFITVLGGQERTTNAGAEFNDQNIMGLRLGAEYALGADSKLFANLNTERRTHQGQDFFFGVDRRDTQVDFSLGAQFTVARMAWGSVRITPQISYTRNRSNISLYTFDRTAASVTARVDF